MLLRFTAILLGTLTIAAVAFVIWALSTATQLKYVFELKDLYEKEKPTPASQR